METSSDGRLTILPPRPSLSRRFLALVIALWFGGAARLHRALDSLARQGRRRPGIPLARAEPDRRLTAAIRVPELHMSAVLVRVRKEPSLCLVDASRYAGAPPLRRTRVG